MNQLTRKKRSFLRHRRRGTVPWHRFALHNGLRVQAGPSPLDSIFFWARRPQTASYRSGGTWVEGPWPPADGVLDKLLAEVYKEFDALMHASSLGCLIDQCECST